MIPIDWRATRLLHAIMRGRAAYLATVPDIEATFARAQKARLARLQKGASMTIDEIVGMIPSDANLHDSIDVAIKLSRQGVRGVDIGNDLPEIIRRAKALRPPELHAGYNCPGGVTAGDIAGTVALFALSTLGAFAAGIADSLIANPII